MLTGMWILPQLQYHGAAALAILTNVTIAVGSLIVLRVNPAHLVVAAVAVLSLIGFYPTAPNNILRVSTLTGNLSAGTMLFNHIGKSATVTVFREGESILSSVVGRALTGSGWTGTAFTRRHHPQMGEPTVGQLRSPIFTKPIGEPATA